MLWFLERDSEVLVCEIRQAEDGPSFEMAFRAPGQPEQVERVGEPSELIRRWLARQQQLRAEGWRPRI